MQDIRQTENYAKYMELLGWKVFGVEGSYIYVKDLYLFSISKMQRPERQNFDSILTKIKNKKKLTIVYIEPKNKRQIELLTAKGFKKTNFSSLPSKTIRFDLSKTDYELMTNMHPKTRYNVGLAKRRGVIIEAGDDISEFIQFWHSSAKKRKMYLSLAKEITAVFSAFKGSAEILWAKRNGDKIAAILVLYTKQAGYYMYAASTKTGNKHQAPSLLIWEAILKSREKGLKYFDFEGIYDSRYPLNSWKGFSRFKKSFGGEVLEFPGALRKINLPFVNY